MLIRSKLLLSAVVSMTAVIALFGLQLYSNSVESDLSIAAQRVLELERNALQLRANEKDFLSRKELQFVEQNQKVHSEIDAGIAALALTFKRYEVSTSALDSFERNLNQYQGTFEQVVQLQQEIGLTPQTGLYGELRSAARDVESLLKEYDQLSLAVAVLQLRRNEKDFMLRRDLSYVESFTNNIQIFTSSLAASSLDAQIQGKIAGLIGQYQKA
ncbi:MAG: methyl-accepting chemotaxis protein, partial [Shewanella sp.]